MSKAVIAVNALLCANATLIATVPAARIFTGAIPQKTTLPAISIELVSATRRQEVSGAGSKLTRSRVQVTVIANTYPALRAALDLVLAALPRSRGTTAGVNIDSVIPESEGPDMSDEESGIFLGSHDFMVTTVDA